MTLKRLRVNRNELPESDRHMLDTFTSLCRDAERSRLTARTYQPTTGPHVFLHWWEIPRIRRIAAESHLSVLEDAHMILKDMSDTAAHPRLRAEAFKALERIPHAKRSMGSLADMLQKSIFA